MGGLKGVAAFAVVIVPSTALSTVAMHATNGVPFSETLLGSAVKSGEQGPCPEGMVFVDSGSGGFCIDAYEASPDAACPYPAPARSGETAENLDAADCRPVSASDGVPWRYVARHQAEALCSSAGKRLPTPEEWYRAALGTPSYHDAAEEPVCNLDGTGPRPAEGLPECRSSAGASNMTGNVWEWVSGDVSGGEWNGRMLPESGYVVSVDGAGLPLETAPDPERSYGNTYAHTKDGDRVSGVLRGGWWGSGTDGGVYAINTTVAPSFAGRAIGFRCARSL